MLIFTRSFRTVTLATGLLLGAGHLLAASIVGVVTNRTDGKPAAGDDVTLIQLAQGMQEAGHTRTDARGHFKLDIPDDGIHLVRVTHDKANYFQPLQPGQSTVDIDVYTAAAKVDGVSTEAEVLHVQTDASGTALDVVASFFVKNLSAPAKTQFSDRPFDFYLPAGAVVDASVALGPGRMSMPVKSPPVPLGDPDHYALIFPLRPCGAKPDAPPDDACGETRFQVSFKLPYTGSLAFTPKVGMLTKTLAVTLPKSMTFRPAVGVNYTTAADESIGQAYIMQNAEPGQPLGFSVSGTGQLPRENSQAQQPDAANQAQGAGRDLTPSEASQAQRADTKPGVGLNNPLDSDGNLEPWSKYKWWIFGGLGLLLAAGAGLMLKGGSVPAAVAAQPAAALDGPPSPPASLPAPHAPSSLLGVLKDELFALETERLAGTLSEADYSAQRAALDIVLKRALARAGTVG